MHGRHAGAGAGQSAAGRNEVEVASFHSSLHFTCHANNRQSNCLPPPPPHTSLYTSKPTTTMRAACLPSTTVTVTVNGRALQELQQVQIDRGSDKGASAYIESAAGAAFAVEMDIEAGLAVYEGSIEFAIYLDGRFMGGSVVDLCNGKQNVKLAGVHECSDEGTGFRRFTFARHEMSKSWGC
jgi:hypothetical protein